MQKEKEKSGFACVYITQVLRDFNLVVLKKNNSDLKKKKHFRYKILLILIFQHIYADIILFFAPSNAL